MVVETGEVPRRGGGGGGAGVGLKEKRIPDEHRTTTPYLTKYERARVLGVRSLQIRYVHLMNPPSFSFAWGGRDARGRERKWRKEV